MNTIYLQTILALALAFFVMYAFEAATNPTQVENNGSIQRLW